MKRVVITGLGIVSCLGNNQEEVHKSLLNSKSGISFSEEYKEHNLKSHVHGKPITIPVLKLLIWSSSNPESLIASFIAI